MTNNRVLKRMLKISRTPPRFLAGNRALDELAAKLRYPILGQRYEQTPSVFAIGILAEDDLALCSIDLADFAIAIVFVPGFLEAEQVRIEAKRALYIGDEEHGARVPPVRDLLFSGLLCHRHPQSAQRRGSAAAERSEAVRWNRGVGRQCALQVASRRLRTRPCILHSSLLHDPFSNSNLAVCAKFRPLASHGTPWQHSKIVHRCDPRRHGRSGIQHRGHRRVF